MKQLRVGSRRSRLALAQTGEVARAWESAGFSVEVVTWDTRGDRVLDRPLADIGQQGLFTAELEQALVAGTVDAAVHSLKDLPLVMPPGLKVGAVTPRRDARDAVLTRDGRRLRDLAPGSRVGTSSLRRQALLRVRYPHLAVVPVRGNLDTRWAKLERGDFEALVLAAAGLERLGWNDRVSEYLDPDWMVPAPGQGALAVEIRADDPEAASAAKLVHDPDTAAATAAERAVLNWVGSNCAVPVGAYVRRTAVGTWQATVFVSDVHGRHPIHRIWEGPDLAVGQAWIQAELEAAGARKLVTG
jgi:hydroxymethylbilane synthase